MSVWCLLLAVRVVLRPAWLCLLELCEKILYNACITGFSSIEEGLPPPPRSRELPVTEVGDCPLFRYRYFSLTSTLCRWLCFFFFVPMSGRSFVKHCRRCRCYQALLPSTFRRCLFFFFVRVKFCEISLLSAALQPLVPTIDTTANYYR